MWWWLPPLPAGGERAGVRGGFWRCRLLSGTFKFCQHAFQNTLDVVEIRIGDAQDLALCPS